MINKMEQNQLKKASQSDKEWINTRVQVCHDASDKLDQFRARMAKTDQYFTKLAKNKK